MILNKIALDLSGFVTLPGSAYEILYNGPRLIDKDCTHNGVNSAKQFHVSQKYDYTAIIPWINVKRLEISFWLGFFFLN